MSSSDEGSGARVAAPDDASCSVSSDNVCPIAPRTLSAEAVPAAAHGPGPAAPSSAAGVADALQSRRRTFALAKAASEIAPPPMATRPVPIQMARRRKRASQEAAETSQEAPAGADAESDDDSPPAHDNVLEQLLFKKRKQEEAKLEMKERVEEEVGRVMDNGVRVNKALQAMHGR